MATSQLEPLALNDEEPKRVAQWCHQLKHEGGLRIVRLLQEIDVGVYCPSQRTTHADCLRYFQNHQHKLDYPRYVKNGWQSEQRSGRDRMPDSGG